MSRDGVDKVVEVQRNAPPSAFFKALTALGRVTPAWVMTSSMSLGSRPVSSGVSSSSASAAAPEVPAAPCCCPICCIIRNCSARAACCEAARSSILASPKMT